MNARTAHISIAIARILFGLVFFIFGLDGFLAFIPRPTTPGPEGAVAFSLALVQTGYMIPLIKGTELLAGALLLTNRFVPLALVLLAPVIVNIVAFHAFLAPEGAPIVVLVVGLELLLAYAYRDSYRALLTVRSAPALSSTRNDARRIAAVTA